MTREAFYLDGKLSRRAYADILDEDSFTGGDADEIWVPSPEWNRCIGRARQALASKERQGLDAMVFTQVACLRFRTSSVTGNLILDEEKRWPVHP